MDREQAGAPGDRGPRAAGQHRGRLSLACGLLLLPACGYHFAVGEGRLADGSRALHVPVADNQTLFADSTVTLTEALREEARRAGLRLVLDGEAPTLQACLKTIVVVPRAVGLVSGRFHARQEEVVVEVWLKLALPGRPAHERTYRERESFLAASDLRGTEANRDLAVRRALTRLARTGIDALAGEF